MLSAVMWMAYPIERMEETLQLEWSGLKSIQEQVWLFASVIMHCVRELYFELYVQ